MGWFDERFQNLHGREHCPCAARWSPSGPLIPGAEFTLWGYGPRACATLIRKEKSPHGAGLPVDAT